MAFTKTSVGDALNAVEVVTLGDTTTVYSSAITRMNLRPVGSVIIILLQASAVTGTNVDINLYGSDTEAGTVKRLITTDLVTALADTTEAIAYVTVSDKPWPYLFLSFLSDADETLNTVTVTIIAPPPGS